MELAIGLVLLSSKQASNGIIPVNTEYITHWAEKNYFVSWAENCNKNSRQSCADGFVA